MVCRRMNNDGLPTGYFLVKRTPLGTLYRAVQCCKCAIVRMHKLAKIVSLMKLDSIFRICLKIKVFHHHSGVKILSDLLVKKLTNDCEYCCQIPLQHPPDSCSQKRHRRFGYAYQMSTAKMN